MKNHFRSYSFKFSIGLVFSLSIVICAFEWKFPVTEKQIINLPEEINEYTDLKLIEEAAPKPKPQPPKPQLKPDLDRSVTLKEPI
ncbi:hypothetical protein BH23BAC1_BH23BAC1_34770 [soil metagenome]